MKTRRTLIGVAAVLAAGLAVEWRHLFGARYKPTPYDDVLARLEDRETAAKLGAAVVKSIPDQPPARLAARLRTLLGARGLASAAQADVTAGRMLDIDGWILPQSVALLAALAAKV